MPAPSARAQPTPSPTARKRRGPDPAGAGERAAHHRATRRAHANETAEDYAEAIYDLIESQGEARVVELAQRLGVSHVTVVRTVARLQRDGLVTARPYRSIFLTDAGRRLALRARRRHAVVVAFLRSLGISEAAALADAEGIEHHVSGETLAAFERATPSPDQASRR